MERFGRKYKLTLYLLAGFFLLLFALVLFLTRNIGGMRGAPGEHPLRISELMANNKTVPNADGVLCDWIEIENTSGSAFDLSGYKLSDDLTGAKYAFPAGTFVPAHGFLVVSCTADYSGGLYAPFSLSRSGGETVVLMTASNVILDKVETLPAKKNTVMVRGSDGSLSLSAAPTPGYPNTEEGHEQYLASRSSHSGVILLSEIVSSNTFYPNADGVCCDWIELHNSGEESVDIGGYMLSDKPGSYRYSFPSGTILEPGAYLVVSCSTEHSGSLYANMGLARTGGETLSLSDATAAVLDQIELPALPDNCSFARTDGEWVVSAHATPGYPNTEEGYLAFCAELGYDKAEVILSEAAASNPAVLADEDGDFPDWVELSNEGGAEIDLSGWFLTDDGTQPDKWRFPAGTSLAPGERLLVFASGKNKTGDALHTNFSLSADETVSLVTPAGQICSSLSLDGLLKGESAVAGAAGVEHSAWPTPGYPNTSEGYAAFQDAQSRVSPLLIYEVAPSNSSRYEQLNVGCSDYIKLKNVSSAPVQLSDYCLSDDCDVPTLWRLPAGQLAPGSTITYFCSGSESNSSPGYIHTNFSINAAGETLLLHTAEGALCDYVWLHDIPPDGHCGRIDGQAGFFIFPAASSGQESGEGYRSVSPTPVSLGADGVFNNVSGVKVELQGAGDIYYTTDGSQPTPASTRYSAPFTVSQTTVIRASCITAGQMPSPPLTLSYILNENHTLPVASLVAEPSSLFLGGIYDSFWLDREVPVSLSFFEEGESFAVECGAEMHGHTALFNEKRSFKISFRPRYGDSLLSYDLFDNGDGVYSSLLLRAGQDYPFAIIRDELCADLCDDFTENVLSQDYKYCVLYLNGEYWGIYCFKEAFSAEYYAAHRSVSPGSVSIEQAPVALTSPFREVIDFATSHDMSKAENYETFSSMVDIDSLIDWCIIEGYSANGDVQQNLRYFRSTENGNRWEYAFYDLDWSFYYDANNLAKVFCGFGEDGVMLQHSIYISAVAKNAEFRDRFCKRLAEALAGPLSTENVLAKIDKLSGVIAPEVPRERQRWYTSSSWDSRVQELRDFVENGWTEKVIRGAVLYCGLSEAQREEYFGGVDK